eukprot:CAMPEP_0204832466 /NCGR_PEP_ID=MMETSP1346-20131115/13767_1 /ASSEMBLY_ACC=CAM_ASM_000771 /TAXON_ID=215587 /ORGANISM="Aplanochytrium stocchinoi, Strain GSBS06" /LENGTH=102 /DNA_ID=CAMNT_0051964287 /DNA_START=104 /DNA_END=408 /DNA_ORIENTATION=-
MSVTTWRTAKVTWKDRFYYFLTCSNPPEMVFEDPEVDPEQANGRTAHEVVEEYRRLQSAYRGSFHSEKDFYKEKNSIETGPALEDVDLDTSIKPTRSREPSS